MALEIRSAKDAGRDVPVKCATCGALQRAICGHLDSGSLSRLSHITHTQHIKRGRSMFWQDEDVPAVGVVQSGVLKLTMSLADGREQTVGLALPGDFVGRPAAAASAYTVTAITDCDVCTVSRSAFQGLAHELPDIEHALLSHSFDELDRARTWLLLLGRKSSMERVATFLLDLWEKCGAPEAVDVPLPMTRQEIAELLGLTIETVSRKLSALKQAGVITLPTLRTFHVISASDLRRRAG